MQKLELSGLDIKENCLQDQIIMITGASDGIGRTLALHAAKAGATTILLGKSLKKLESLFDEISQLGYPEPALHPINFLNTEPEAIYDLVSHVKNMFGRLNGLVHNASDYGQLTPIEHLPPNKWQNVLQVNLNIPYLLTHAFLPLMKESAPANILFTLADEAFVGKAYWSAYSASKFGLYGLAQALYQECETNTGVRVNCINPKAVRTASRMKAYPGMDPERFQTAESIMPYYLDVLSNPTINGNLIETRVPELALS